MTKNNNETNYFYWPSIEDAETRVLAKSFISVKQIYGCNLPSVVRERLEWELDAICEHDFSVIFYAFGEIARKAHEEGYVTSTRGAAASSLVSYLLGITDINPLPSHYRCKRCKHSEFDVGDGYDAHKYMRICSLGKLGEAQFSGEWEKLAKKHNVEDWYIESAKKITWLGSMAHAVESALAQYRIAWYKTHYPKEFCKVTGSKGKIL